MDNILSVKKLDYNGIFKDVNIKFYRNTFNLITGSNKCGKSTLIRILCGLIETKNTIFYKENDIYNLSSHDLSSIFSVCLFENLLSFSYQTVNDEVQYYLDQTNLTVSERRMKYKYLLKIFNLNKVASNDISSLTYYEKVKLRVLCSIICTPEILILDSTFDGLLENEVLEIIDSLKHIGGMTVIVNTHKLDFSCYFDYMYVFDKGKLLLSGKVLDVLKQDSILNKIGLSLPFMVDLSLKLKYYDLLDKIILDIDGMVNQLWN